MGNTLHAGYLVSVTCILFAHAALAGDAPYPSAYTIFNPVPDDNMRDFSPDRPGKTHSSTTVDAGHIQIESDFVNYTYDHSSPDRQSSQSLVLGAPLLKVGITNDIDLEAGLSLYDDVHSKDRTTGAVQNGEGFGDILLGSKINLFGNNGGRQALAIVPFVKIPTANRDVGNGRAEYMVNLPYEIKLSDPWSLTLEPAANLLRNVNNDNLHGDYSFAANINRPVFIDTLTASLEIFSEFSAEPHVQNQYTFDPALQWLVTPAVQLDVGVYIGLNKAAPDLDAYTGFSVRF